MIWKALALMLIGSLSGAIGLWVADRDPPTQSVRERELLTPVVEPGGHLLIRYHVARRKSCAVRVERVIYDGASVRYVLDDQAFTSVPVQNGPETYISKIPVPVDIAPGNAVYRAVATFTCNPIHRLFWPIESPVSDVHFRVSARGA